MSEVRSTLKAEPRGDRELFLTRAFAAPRERVYAAHVEPALLTRWLSTARATLTECRFEARPGGEIRYVWRHRGGGTITLRGTVEEVVPNQRIVHTEVFDDDWTGGPVRVTTTFHDDPLGSRVELILRYASAAGREMAVRTGMLDGMAEGYALLDEVSGVLEPGAR